MKNVLTAILAVFITSIIVVNVILLEEPLMVQKKIYGEIVEAKQCPTGIKLLFLSHGFQNPYLGSDIEFSEIENSFGANWWQIYLISDKEIGICVTETLLKLDASFKYKVSVMKSIYLWEKEEDYLSFIYKLYRAVFREKKEENYFYPQE